MRSFLFKISKRQIFKNSPGRDIVKKTNRVLYKVCPRQGHQQRTNRVFSEYSNLGNKYFAKSNSKFEPSPNHSPKYDFEPPNKSVPNWKFEYPTIEYFYSFRKYMLVQIKRDSQLPTNWAAELAVVLARERPSDCCPSRQLSEYPSP